MRHVWFARGASRTKQSHGASGGRRHLTRSMYEAFAIPGCFGLSVVLMTASYSKSAIVGESCDFWMTIASRAIFAIDETRRLFTAIVWLYRPLSGQIERLALFSRYLPIQHVLRLQSWSR